MNTEVYRTLKINAPNVRWNTYEYISKKGFWGSETFYIRVKDKYGEYAKEEHRVVGDDWYTLGIEIDLINWLLREKISKKDLETIKSTNFSELYKEFINKNTGYVHAMLNSYDSTKVLIKKRWALELWAAYQNNYHLNGVRTFRISDGTTKEYIKSLGVVGELSINGISYISRNVDADFWKWPEEYKIIY